MGKYFSDVVDKAIEDIYYCYDAERAGAAAEAMFQAAKDGDGDACYFLSRCFSGTCYSWEYHPFEENEAAAYAMLREAVAKGSAVGVLGALRMDMLTPDMRESMPFESVQAAWDAVNEKAEAGCLFCQYMIGNTYYFLDVIEIGDRSEREFGSRKAWDDWRREQMEKSLPLFESAFSGGMGLAGRNYRDFYEDGRGDLIPPDKSKYQEILRRGAEMGYPEWMYHYAAELEYKLHRPKEALPWALKAAEAGHLFGWHVVADVYTDGGEVELNYPYAIECLEKTASRGNDNYACGLLGMLYFRGLGTPQDYGRAVYYLERKQSDSYNDLLGLCCLLGYGCQQDVRRGKELLERGRDGYIRDYGLGMLYAEGLGVRENIGRGVEYLEKAASAGYEPAKEALTHYKKSLFGVWRRK